MRIQCCRRDVGHVIVLVRVDVHEMQAGGIEDVYRVRRGHSRYVGGVVDKVVEGHHAVVHPGKRQRRRRTGAVADPGGGGGGAAAALSAVRDGLAAHPQRPGDEGTVNNAQTKHGEV